MRYILIANNKRLNQDTINKAKITNDDCIIVFNYMKPFYDFPIVHNHPNKIFIGRQRPIKPATVDFPYAGIDLVREHQDKFKKIIFHSHPKFFSDNNENKQRLQKGIDKYNFDPNKLDHLEPVSNQTRKRISYPEGKNMSTGIIAYDYFQQIKNPEDTVLLIGFTSELARSFHNDNWEVVFFKKQIETKQCDAIGCCDLEQKKYQHIYQKLKWKSYLRSNHGAKAKDLVIGLNPKSILDIGCGPNLFCKETIDSRIPCTGLDFAGTFYDIYGDICTNLNQIGNKQFDLVTAFDVMEHLLPSCIDIAFFEMQRISNKFVFKIDYKESVLKVFDSSLHQTVKSKNWWMRKIKEYSSDAKQSGKYIYGTWKVTS